MPVEYVPAPEGPGYRWGGPGKVYRTSTHGRDRARALAAAQGRAIQARADAPPWRLAEPKAPSPREYLRLVDRWFTDIRRWWRLVERAADRARRRARGDADGDVTADDDLAAELAAADRAYWLRRSLDRARDTIPEPPDVEDIATAAAPSARQSIRAARRGLVAAGMPMATVATRLGIAPPPPPAAPPPVAGGGGFGGGGVGVPASQVVGIDVAPTASEQAALRGWASEGVDLIRRVERELLDDLDSVIAEAARGGVRVEVLARRLEERLGIHSRHAQLIARDQTGKLNARITEATHQAAGVTQYRWRTARDQRVRDRHRELEATVWDSAGPGAPGAGPYGQPAHPGMAIQCRCYREPIVPDVD